MKKANTYQNWLEARLEHRSFDKFEPLEEDLKADPDLAQYKEPKRSDALEAAIEVIQEGGLTHLEPTEQKIFQLSIVEGESDADIAHHLRIDEEAVAYHLQRIGLKLRKLCNEKLQGL